MSEVIIWPKIEFIDLAVCPCCGTANNFEHKVVPKSSNVKVGGALYETECLECGESTHWGNWLFIR